MVDNLKEVLKTQKEALTKFEEELNILSSNDYLKENTELKTELEDLKLKYSDTLENIEKLKTENNSLRNKWYDQFYNERNSILNSSSKKLDVYFKTKVDDEINKLQNFETYIRKRIDEMTEVLKKNRIDTTNDLYKQINSLSILVDKKVNEAKETYSKMSTDLHDTKEKEIESIKRESMTEEQFKIYTRKLNWEAFIGQNLINKIGILLIIIGVIAASQFNYFGDLIRGIIMFSCGGVMLVIGELMNRKKANVFSIGMSSGGIAILYIANFMSYFQLDILSMYPALMVCLLITAVSFILSQRYNSQVIISFALIGGYLPILVINQSASILYGLIVYLVVLNLLSLLISFNKKWTIASYVGLILNIAGNIYMALSIGFYRKDNQIYSYVFLSYILFSFIIYTAIPIISTYKAKLKFKTSDVFLLGINTFFNCLLIYYAFYEMKLGKYYGLLAIGFVIVYITLAKIIEFKFKDSENMQALFYLTGLCFVILVVPLQFDKAWISLGWLCEGVLITTYGILKNQKSFKLGGFIINILCVVAFIIFDVNSHMFYYNDLFEFKHTAITIGSLIILGAYIYKKEQFNKSSSIFRYITSINLWFYIVTIVRLLDDKLHFLFYNKYKFTNVSYLKEYLLYSIFISLTFLLSYCLINIKKISDKGTKIIGVIFYIISLLTLIFINTTSSPFYEMNFYNKEIPTILMVVGTIVIVIINLLSVLAVKDILKLIVNSKKLNLEFYSIIISSYFVLTLTHNLITHYNLEFSNLIISIIYVITAVLWVILGFTKKYHFLRKFGLSLSLLAVAKLFIVDLSYLTQGYRIISYFALGISLILISYVYQYFSKVFKIKE